MFEAFKRSLGTKITLWLSCALIIVLGIVTIINIIYQNRVLIDREHESAKRLGETVLTSIRYPMMTGDQDVIQLQFDKFKELEGIEVLHLLDHNGVIKRSTDRSLIGEKSKATNLDKALRGEEFIGVELRQRTRGRVYSELRPIPNEESCYACHGSTQKVLGVLRLGVDWQPVDSALTLTRNRNIIISVVGLVFIGALVFILLRAMLTKPISTLIAAAGGLASRAGDLTQRIKITGQDEIGRLGSVFNQIIDSMHEMVLQIRTTAEKVASSSQQLSSSTQEVNASTQEVSTAIQQITKGATTQSERVDETLEIMEKASVALKQMMANAQAATSGVSESSQKAESGRASAQETVEKILRLTNTVTDTAKVIQTLGERSQQIGEITETITSIADQTNLLALNAAIEAARAGEAGRGFAVVAEEVRKLAEGSAEAVRKIGNLIKSIQAETGKAVSSIEASSKEVQEGKDMVARIAELLIEINKAVQESSDLTKQIAEATTEQVQGTERVVTAVNEVAAVAKESVSTAEEVSSSVEEQTASMQEMAASAQELARLAMELKDMVSKFKLREAAAKTA
jgi:methyl-accepting chemotaxis protein